VATLPWWRRDRCGGSAAVVLAVRPWWPRDVGVGRGGGVPIYDQVTSFRRLPSSGRDGWPGGVLCGDRGGVLGGALGGGGHGGRHGSRVAA
jgi:hypothetical protein